MDRHRRTDTDRQTADRPQAFRTVNSLGVDSININYCLSYFIQHPPSLVQPVNYPPFHSLTRSLTTHPIKPTKQPDRSPVP
ncbi:hypothetical protein FJTKL_00409 [Diaporthe vaccinii]|uniref:Uncharacterized protein n=1 Tax=Diaporthe vaccinii TaxID=105482 RepID=A0ABR4E344_9PEZI